MMGWQIGMFVTTLPGSTWWIHRVAPIIINAITGSGSFVGFWSSEPNSDGFVDLDGFGRCEFTTRIPVEFWNFKVQYPQRRSMKDLINNVNFIVLLTSKLSKPTKGWLPPCSAFFTILLGDIQLRAGAGGRANNGETKGWCRPQWLKLRDSKQFQDAWWTNWLMIWLFTWPDSCVMHSTWVWFRAHSYLKRRARVYYIFKILCEPVPFCFALVVRLM